MTKIKVILNGLKFPLISQSGYYEFIKDYGIIGDYFIKPKFKWLPNMENLDEEEKANYPFKNIPEDLYLVGLEVVSESWVNKGFCGSIQGVFGLALEDSYPLTQNEDKFRSSAMIRLNFEHMGLDFYNSKNLSTVIEGQDDDESED